MLNNLAATFEKFADEYATFPQVVTPRHRRPDICAFLLLDALVPSDGYPIVRGASHDLIFLDTDTDLLAEKATEDDILTLVRCGVRYVDDNLAMFV